LRAILVTCAATDSFSPYVTRRPLLVSLLPGRVVHASGNVRSYLWTLHAFQSHKQVQRSGHGALT